MNFFRIPDNSLRHFAPQSKEITSGFQVVVIPHTASWGPSRTHAQDGVLG